MVRKSLDKKSVRDPFPHEADRALYRVRRRRAFAVGSISYLAGQEVILPRKMGDAYVAQLELVEEPEVVEMQTDEPMVRTRAMAARKKVSKKK